MIIDGVDSGWTTVTVQETDFTVVQAKPCFSTVAQIQVNLANPDATVIADYPRITTFSFDAAAGFKLSSPIDGTVLVSLRNSNPLYFTIDGDYRILTHYVEDGKQAAIRKTEFTEDQLKLTLASFTPQITASGIPSSNLLWDQPASGFKVTVENPLDYPDKWISSVYSLDDTAGLITRLDTFSTTGPNTVPGSTGHWSQDFLLENEAIIRPFSSNISGGHAAADLVFYATTTAGIAAEYPHTVKLDISWATPQTTCSIERLTDATFIQSYASCAYTVTTSGLLDKHNCSISIEPTGGTVSSSSTGGIFVFDLPQHKDSNWRTNALKIESVFTRPVTVTGTEYSVSTLDTILFPQPHFSYPSLIVFTPGTAVTPTVDDFISGTEFASGVQVLGDSVRVFAGYITNDTANPLAAWFAIRAAAPQPSVFRTGISPSLLNAVNVTVDKTVELKPNPQPVDYIPETYKLYGITLQPGVTFVSIA